MRRIDAEKYLLHNLNDHGAFMVRDSESRQHELSLSGEFPMVNHTDSIDEHGLQYERVIV